MSKNDRRIIPRRESEIYQMSARWLLLDLVFEWSVQTGSSQRVLCSSLGVHQTTMSRWKNGERGTPEWVIAQMSMMTGYALDFDPQAGWKSPSLQNRLVVRGNGELRVPRWLHQWIEQTGGMICMSPDPTMKVRPHDRNLALVAHLTDDQTTGRFDDEALRNTQRAVWSLCGSAVYPELNIVPGHQYRICERCRVTAMMTNERTDR